MQWNHLPLLASLAFTSLASAQTTWLIGPNGFPTITSILFFAQDGDNVHYEPGTYPPFECSIGLNIRALVPGTVTIEATGHTRFQLTPSQTLQLTDIDFEGRVQVDFGRIAMVGCSFGSTTHFGSLHAVYAHDAAIHIVDCEFQMSDLGTTSSKSAVRFDNCDVTAIDSRFWGTPAGSAFGGDGIFASGSRLHLSNCDIRGDQLFTTSAALHLLHGTTAWVTDSTITANFVCPTRADYGTVLYTDGVTINGTGGANCGDAPVPKSMLAVSQPTPLQAGAPFTLEYRGQPNGLLAVFAAPLLATHDVPGLLDQPSWIDNPTSFLAGLAVLDPTGNISMTWNIPAGPGIADLSLWFKGIGFDALPWQVAPVAGGIARN